MSQQVVEAIAALHHGDALELEPLYHSIDTDALDALYGRDERDGSGPTLTFRTNGYEVTVREGEQIVVRAVTDD